MVNREWRGTQYKTPEGVLHSGRLGPLNGWRSFWVAYACLTYHNCDMSVSVCVCGGGLVETKGGGIWAYKGTPQKNKRKS